MRLSRLITAVAVGLAVSSLPAAPGAAQPAYPPTEPSLTLSATTVVVGEEVTLFGRHFGRNEPVDIRVTTEPLAARAPGAGGARTGTVTTVAMMSVDQDVDTRHRLVAHTDRHGNFRIRYRPEHKGEYTFTATGRRSHRTASATLTVLKRRHHLPVTGNDVGPQIAVGSGLLAAGVAMMLLTVLWRRRSRRRGEASQLESMP